MSLRILTQGTIIVQLPRAAMEYNSQAVRLPSGALTVQYGKIRKQVGLEPLILIRGPILYKEEKGTSSVERTKAQKPLFIK